MAASIELAERLAERLCHDFAGAGQGLTSGLDLLGEAASESERDEAIAFLKETLAAQSAKVAYARSAFGRPAAAEAEEIRCRIEQRFAGGRDCLTWEVGADRLGPQAARILLLLAEIGAEIAAAGGTVRLVADAFRLAVEVAGPRIALRPEARAGLAGEALGEGHVGRWIEAAFLAAAVRAAGGVLALAEGSEAIAIRISLPQSV